MSVVWGGRGWGCTSGAVAAVPERSLRGLEYRNWVLTGPPNVPVLTPPRPRIPLAPARPRLLHVSRTSSNGGFPCRTLASAHAGVCSSLETTFPSAGVNKVNSGAQDWRLFGTHRPLLGPGGVVTIVYICSMRYRERQWGQQGGAHAPCGGGAKRYIGPPQKSSRKGLETNPRSTPRQLPPLLTHFRKYLVLSVIISQLDT